jgi:hypothetical protein
LGPWQVNQSSVEKQAGNRCAQVTAIIRSEDKISLQTTQRLHLRKRLTDIGTGGKAES